MDDCDFQVAAMGAGGLLSYEQEGAPGYAERGFASRTKVLVTAYGGGKAIGRPYYCRKGTAEPH